MPARAYTKARTSIVKTLKLFFGSTMAESSATLDLNGEIAVGFPGGLAGI